MANRKLQEYYNSELNQLQEDIDYLSEASEKYGDHISEIVSLSLASDESYAQSIVDANNYLAQAVNFATIASGCGCSVAIGSTGDYLAGTATTVYYEVAQAVMENGSYDNYIGDDPQGDAASVNLTSGSGSGTVLVPANFGRGISNRVSAGSSVVLLSVLSLQPNPGTCSSHCSYYRDQQQAAITNYNNEKSSGSRTTDANKSATIKEEAKEYRLQRWAYKKAEGYTQDRYDRINTFYPETK